MRRIGPDLQTCSAQDSQQREGEALGTLALHSGQSLASTPQPKDKEWHCGTTQG